MANYGNSFQWSLYRRDNGDQDDKEICHILSDTNQGTSVASNVDQVVPLVNPKPNKIQPSSSQFGEYRELHQISGVAAQQNGFYENQSVNQMLEIGESKCSRGPPPGFSYNTWEEQKSMFSQQPVDSEIPSNKNLQNAISPRGNIDCRIPTTEFRNESQGAFKPFNKDTQVSDGSFVRSLGRTPGPSKQQQQSLRQNSTGGLLGVVMRGSSELERLSPGPEYVSGQDFASGGSGSWETNCYPKNEGQFSDSAAFQQHQAMQYAQGFFPSGLPSEVGRLTSPQASNYQFTHRTASTPEYRQMTLQTPDIEKQFEAFKNISLHDPSPESEAFNAQYGGHLAATAAAAAEPGKFGARLFGSGSPIKWQPYHGDAQEDKDLIPQVLFPEMDTSRNMPGPNTASAALQQQIEKMRPAVGPLQTPTQGIPYHLHHQHQQQFNHQLQHQHQQHIQLHQLQQMQLNQMLFQHQHQRQMHVLIDQSTGNLYQVSPEGLMSLQQNAAASVYPQLLQPQKYAGVPASMLSGAGPPTGVPAQQHQAGSQQFIAAHAGPTVQVHLPGHTLTGPQAPNQLVDAAPSRLNVAENVRPGFDTLEKKSPSTAHWGGREEQGFQHQDSHRLQAASRNPAPERGHRRGQPHPSKKDSKQVMLSGSYGLQEEAVVQEPQPQDHYPSNWSRAPSSGSSSGGWTKAAAPSRRLYDEIVTKRAELVESPTTRLHFKDFYRQFRAKEKTSFEAAKQFALTCFGNLPQKVHWRLWLEIAELSKRENHFQEARKIYRKVCEMQPYACQGWLEYSKLEEECGNLEKCSRILRRGLMFCHYSEGLFIKAIKHEERLHNLKGARELLSRLKRVGIEKVWRTVLEGALLEARSGNTAVARKIFRYLMQQVPWYGPIYYEAFRLEEKNEHFTSALQIIERGLAEIPRYGPLWFGAFRLCERIDMRDAELALARGDPPTLRRTHEAIVRAREAISKELVWKVHFEAAQIEERFALLITDFQERSEAGKDRAEDKENSRPSLVRPAKKGAPSLPPPIVGGTSTSNTSWDVLLSPCRRCYASAALACPANLRWKVWLAGARTELMAGPVDRVTELLYRAFQEVPDKSRSHVFLECSRVEEFAGRLGAARKILARARQETRTEWKVFLESVLLEIRAGDVDRALLAAEQALSVHSGTGRLWAILVQLKQREGDLAQRSVLRRALREVPKSGEVWCEGARVHLNPLHATFALETARRYLEFAIQFTPQYGDSFMECLRLDLISKLLVPKAEEIVKNLKRQPIGEPCCFGRKSACSGAELASESDDHQCQQFPPPVDFSALETYVDVDCCCTALVAEDFVRVDTKDLEIRCVNADPNYGSMWFHCRQKPSDTARSVLWRAKSMMSIELQNLQHVYVKAIVRYMLIEQQIRHCYRCGFNEENRILEACKFVPPLKAAGSKLKIKGEDFVTGLVRLNRITANMSGLSSEEKRKILFGSDQIVP